MTVTLTAKIKIHPTESQVEDLKTTIDAYKQGCNYISKIIYNSKELNQRNLHPVTYKPLRLKYKLKSQMAQSVIKTAVARYKTNKSNGHTWTLVNFKRPEYDLVYNRDYSLISGILSLNTLSGRIKVPFDSTHYENFFDGTWSFGTAKLVQKHKQWFLHIPFSKEIETLENEDVKTVVGIDFGINFLAVAYDSNGKTTFFSGKETKQKRAHYKKLRKELQQKQTPSARRKLKTIGQRENRWMTNVNHNVSKALVAQYGSNTLFVVENLQGIRTATEKVKLKNRYVSVSWAFYQLRTFLEYKSQLALSKTIAVDPKYTSQRCPVCGHIHKTNRDKKNHIFCCQKCGYASNDDRVAGMNLQFKGIEYLTVVAA